MSEPGDLPSPATAEEKTEAAPEAGWLGSAVVSVGGVFAIAILASAFILVIEVVLRYGFNAPTIWAHETVIFLNACAFVYGGLYAASRNGHIRVVLIYDQLSPRWRRSFDVVISIVCLVACLFFVVAAWEVLMRAIFTPAGDFRLETSGSAWNPPTPGLLKLFLFAILVVMAAQFAVLTVNYARGRR